ncbi:bifunctional [glutamine synthetase] adenylyltransferase/[glutamine synthetase]-adenylyl-L-tyrosine phosphorylase [Kordiimonas sp. SCSIO 12603]|uniref:bifunctional [glutamine synthetase] adenylyltransferase/[glutamine synthetase]-adenylyl-L-tyrosine phosphorylase n=1 Tax=Kordiimonas sp. SCSIO 12603 TaxID=2829596 RepID=UPI0021021FA4|nr:bifunctional [glutamine synthetase] adenylyltransferase/[glutamine synthetase]-adenylyl-L-tyrosine phosphorylase [Kordiimonas sp. SCSIO 12603]UTW57326.1 bifunctional [glutamine synthetase] adenylyltransferase/[glutamine synthetase]-adenylyl-L-tyrosine phosphorylase [Kordiimonas sp. SCSIO 12603]
MSAPISPYPSAYDTAKADEIWALLCISSDDEDKIADLKAKSAAIFGNSPYLASLAIRFTDEITTYLCSDLESELEKLFTEMAKARPGGETTNDLMAYLRNCKSKLALLTAVADVSNIWPLMQITKALSDFASLALDIGLSHLLHQRMKKGELNWPDGEVEPVTPSLGRNSGYFLLGMGKLGAGELNYSSDIDLIALFDPELVHYSGNKTPAQCYIKITQELMQIIEKRTMHGYVFRTDLRLRPDPGSTPVAISVYAAESYYHSMAANWERSAMIKASVVAGDRQAGEQYLQSLSSWVWRRHMDFAALKDIASIKNQIDRHYQHTDLAVGPDYNVKLGKGGIREIEFYAQINQLLHAGRHPNLRIKGTMEALRLLLKQELVSEENTAALIEAYIFLRTIEHRIQMVNDEQCHSIPSEQEQIKRLALFSGFSSEAELFDAISMHSAKVSKIYAELLPNDQAPGDTLCSEMSIQQQLEENSFPNIEGCLSAIKDWRSGKYRALYTDRAKRLLDQCLPSLIIAFSKTDNPAAALMRFDKFLKQLPAGVQLFSLLQSNPSLFMLLARVMGLAPALAETLAKKPTLWDMVLEPHFFEPIEDHQFIKQDLEIRLSAARDFQDVLDFVRIFVAEQKFRAGIHLLESIASVEEVGSALTRVADVTLELLVPAVEREFSRRHGTFPGGGIAILAMGKYGGKELTHTSDLDIVFLYHIEGECIASDGEKPLSPSQYYSRLGQNIITAITALTSEGRLFEVDTRLRPSGSQGPLVVTLKTFEDYYENSAWTWEHMALTRARLILAPKAMHAPLERAIETVLTKVREEKSLVQAVHDMRTKLFSEFGSANKWAVKHCQGGLVDMEFICQYLMLLHGNRHPNIFTPTLSKAINKLNGIGALSDAEQTGMHAAHEYMQQIQSLLRLSVGSAPASGEDIPEGLKLIMLQTTQKKNFAELENQLAKHQDFIYKLYQSLIETAANQIA